MTDQAHVRSTEIMGGPDPAGDKTDVMGGPTRRRGHIEVMGEPQTASEQTDVMRGPRGRPRTRPT